MNIDIIIINFVHPSARSPGCAAAIQLFVSGNVSRYKNLLLHYLEFVPQYCMLLVFNIMRMFSELCVLCAHPSERSGCQDDEPTPAAPSHEASSALPSKKVFPIGLKPFYEPESALVE